MLTGADCLPIILFQLNDQPPGYSPEIWRFTSSQPMGAWASCSARGEGEEGSSKVLVDRGDGGIGRMRLCRRVLTGLV